MSIKSEKVCLQCGFKFIPKTTSSVYCSHECSKLAYKRRKKQEREAQRAQIVSEDEEQQQSYISVAKATSLFAVSRSNLYRLIRIEKIRAVRVSERLLRVNIIDVEESFPLRLELQQLPKRTKKKLYSLEPKDCYTIGEISKKYMKGETTVYTHIRKYSIPTRQIGKFVYVPKSEIDKLYKPKK